MTPATRATSSRRRARVTRQHADGRTITLTNLGPGEIFGELAMFGGEVRSATVEALDDVQAVAILADDLKRLLAEHPEIAVKLLGALGEKLREANARIARQSFQKVSSRVAGVLAGLVGDRIAPAGAGRARPGARSWSSTQADLAQLAGTSREAASRFLATLQRAGVVTSRRGASSCTTPPRCTGISTERVAVALVAYGAAVGLGGRDRRLPAETRSSPLDVVTHRDPRSPSRSSCGRSSSVASGERTERSIY